MRVREISRAEMDERVAAGKATLLDIRPIAAYNGWALAGEPRGGHLPGAVAFPRTWLRFAEWPEALRARGVAAGRPLILYGYDKAEAAEPAARLREAGHEDVGVFAGFDAWAADARLPLERLPRYRQLVHPDWVRDLLAGKRPAGFDGGDHVICHGGYDYRQDYEEGHIPGAIYLDTLRLESPETWNRRSPEELRRTLGELGIRRDTTVVLYGRFSYPDRRDERPGKNAGHLAAIRCAVILMYAGVQDVRVLNGGMAAWQEAGYEVSRRNAEPRPAADFGGPIPGHPEYMIDLPEARELLAAPDGALVSVRSWEEYIGEVSGYNYIRPAGRIPGAVFGNCGSDAYHMENYRNLDHTLREYHWVAAEWAKNGIVPGKRVAFYCGTGWRASEAFLNAYLMGWPRIAVYDGGWFEWSGDPANPVATGVPDAG